MNSTVSVKTQKNVPKTSQNSKTIKTTTKNHRNSSKALQFLWRNQVMIEKTDPHQR